MKEATILIVDDTPQNVRLLEAVLGPLAHRIVTATNGQEALDAVAREHPDIVLLDIQMPVMDGYETCRRLRSDEATVALPVLMITASGEAQKVKGLECGADDFVAKPFDPAELRARVQSMLRIKRYHDKIQQQAAELAEWNRTLDARVKEQVAEMERLGRLRRFLSPQVADAVVSADDDLLSSHRRELAILFCDLRGFTAFTTTAEPEEVMAVLDHYYDAMGELVRRFEATVGDLAGDGVMVYFNDPLPCEDPAVRAVELALEIRSRMAELTARWRKHGYELGYGVGIALGYATLGTIGFEGRVEYGPVGTVVNLASRLCDEASDDVALLDRRAMAAVDGSFETEPLEPVVLKGFNEPVPAYRLVGRRERASQAEPRELSAGEEFAGYRIEGVLGRGGMGVVYRAHELALARPVALKLIAPSLLADEAARVHFVREARVAASLEHPNVIPIYAAGEHDGTAYIAMRLVDGSDLHAHVTASGALVPERAAALVAQVASALDAAHGAGLVHRDVKPGNVLVAAGDHAYLTDFGLARRRSPEGGEAPAGGVAGTASYLAPEVLDGAMPDAHADIYALGCLLFFALTGAAPFHGADRSTAAPVVSEVAAGVPATFDPVIARALDERPERRFPSATALAHAARSAAATADGSEEQTVTGRA